MSDGSGNVMAHELDPSRIRDISAAVLDNHGRMRVLPAAFWTSTTPSERALFGHQHGIYSFPTTELVEYLRELIDGRSAIEIGAGHGVLAQALGIPATDNRMQAKARYRRIYEQAGQPTVKYGRNVVELNAAAAVRRYRPDVVIGCWVTHKWEPHRHGAGGNEIGIDEANLIANVEQYVVIGNDQVHGFKPIWELPHSRTYLPFIYSRAANGSPDFLAIWPGGKRDG
jgi:hypothetical protein